MNIDKITFSKILGQRVTELRPIDMMYSILFGEQAQVGNLTITRFDKSTFKRVKNEIKDVMLHREEDELLWTEDKSKQMIFEIVQLMLNMRMQKTKEEIDADSYAKAASWIYSRHDAFTDSMYAFEMSAFSDINTNYNEGIELLNKAAAERRLAFYMIMHRRDMHIISERHAKLPEEDIEIGHTGIKTNTIFYKL